MAAWIVILLSVFLTVSGSISCFARGQRLVLAGVALLVFALSLWQKTGTRTCFLAMLVFMLPLVLQMLGFSFAGHISLYPLYSWMASGNGGG